MKPKKCLLSFLLLFVAMLSPGCGASDRQEVRKVITTELNLLKSLNSSAMDSYLSASDLFPDQEEGTFAAEEIKDVFSLFFKPFSYKIQDVQTTGDAATASVRITTLDARSLAKDYAAFHLRKEIELSANADSDPSSLEDRYRILNHLLKTRNYGTVESDIGILLNRIDGKWEIQKTDTLENALVGLLISHLSDPEILSPEETLSVYLDTLKELNTMSLGSFLKVDRFLEDETDTRYSIAEALCVQLKKHFDYAVLDTRTQGYSSAVSVRITTFDSASILGAYQEQLDSYLSSPDSLIDGSNRRREIANQFLLTAIRENNALATEEVVLHLLNDGISWKLTDPAGELGTALLGVLKDPEITLEDVA